MFTFCITFGLSEKAVRLRQEHNDFILYSLAVLAIAKYHLNVRRLIILCGTSRLPVAGTGTRKHFDLDILILLSICTYRRNSRVAHRPGNQSRAQYVHRFPLIFVCCSSRVTVPSPIPHTRNRPVCRALPLYYCVDV